MKGKPDLGADGAALGVGEAFDGGACLSPYTKTLDWYDSVPSEKSVDRKKDDISKERELDFKSYRFTDEKFLIDSAVFRLLNMWMKQSREKKRTGQDIT